MAFRRIPAWQMQKKIGRSRFDAEWPTRVMHFTTTYCVTRRLSNHASLARCVLRRNCCRAVCLLLKDF